MESGDRVVYSITGMHGVAEEVLQNGSAYVLFDNGSVNCIEGEHLYLEKPKNDSLAGRYYLPEHEERIQQLLDQGIAPFTVGVILSKELGRSIPGIEEKCYRMRGRERSRRIPTVNIKITELADWYECGWKIKRFTKVSCDIVWPKPTDPTIPEKIIIGG